MKSGEPEAGSHTLVRTLGELKMQKIMHCSIFQLVQFVFTHSFLYSTCHNTAGASRFHDGGPEKETQGVLFP